LLPTKAGGCYTLHSAIYNAELTSVPQYIGFIQAALSED